MAEVTNENWGNEEGATIALEDLPKPTGWKIIVQPTAPKEVTSGGIILADQSKEAEEYNNCRGKVLAIGSMAWRGNSGNRQDPEQWHGGAWAKEGDWVTYGKYAGQKLVVKGVKILILNDDEITSVLPDPGVLTVYA